MKTLSIIILTSFLLLNCSKSKTNGTNSGNEQKSKSQEVVSVDTTFTFDNYELGKIPSGWTQYYTGISDTTDWKIVDDGGNKVLAQLSEEDVKGHFNSAQGTFFLITLR